MLTGKDLTGRELGIAAWEHWGKYNVPVFPCGDKNGQPKVPLVKWKGDSSTDRDTIIAMFEARGSRAKYIGAVMGTRSGLFAVDFDLYKGPKARQYMDTLMLSKALPPTRIHETMSGGLHYIYSLKAGQKMPRNAVPADGVEIRGEGGYIIVPPTDGYKVIEEELDDAPDELLKRIKRSDEAFRSLTISGLTQKIMAGESFHEALTSIAAKMHSRGDEPAKVLKALQDAMNGSVASDPKHNRHSRWLAIMEGADGELARLSTSAFQKYNPRRDQMDVAQVAPRVAAANRNRDVTLGGFFAAVPTVDEPVKDAPARPAAPAGPVNDFPFERAYTASKVDDQDNKLFLLYPLIMEGDVVILSAEPKAGKTLTAMSICLHAASGVPFGDVLTPLGADGKTKKIPIVYFALEGQGAVRKRVKAWLAQYRKKFKLSLTEDDIRLFVVERPINLADEEAKQELVDKLLHTEHYFKGKGWGGIGMVVFDTLTKAMPGKDQNSVEDTSDVFNTIDRMREVDVNCAVMFVHHNNKNSRAPRGSSNILAEPDTILSVKKIDPIVVKDKQLDCVEMSVYMARAIDDGQVYRMATHDVEIGNNVQGIMESAPVQEMLDDYFSATKPADNTLRKAGNQSKEAFYNVVWQGLMDAPGMTMTFGQLSRLLRAQGNDAALAFMAGYVNGTDKASVKTAWETLAFRQNLPPSMSGMSLVVKDEGVTMHLDLSGAAIG